MNRLFRYAYLGLWGAVALAIVIPIVVYYWDDLPVVGEHDRNMDLTYNTCYQQLRDQRIYLAIVEEVCTCLAQNFETLRDFDPTRYLYAPREMIEDLRPYCLEATEKLETHLDER